MKRFRDSLYNLQRRAWPEFGLLIVCCALLPGCAAFHPMTGVPARYIPEDYRGFSRAGKRTIDLSLLKRSQPKSYLIDSGDVLGIYIEGVLGDRKLAQPVNIPLNNETPPTFGFPIPVRDDGTISLPLVGSLDVRGLSIADVEARLKDAYTRQKQFLNPENDRILVSLQRPRMYRALVIRQEASAPQIASQGMLNTGALKRGTGHVVNLPAYKNDVLTALTMAGGLPGLDAENAIYVIRRRRADGPWSPPPGGPLPEVSESATTSNVKTIVRAQAPDNWTPPTSGGHSLPLSRQRSEAVFDSQVQPANYQPPLADSSRYSIPNSYHQPPPEMLQRPGPSSPGDVVGGPGVLPMLPPPPPIAPHQVVDQHWQNQSQLPPAPMQPWHGPQDPLPDNLPPETAPDALPAMTPEEFGWKFDGAEPGDRHIVRIPVRLGPGETVDITEQDIILEDGDIIFIESRDTEVFYTGGLLGGGQFTLPRDYDLNVLQAIAVAQGQRNGGGGASRGTTSMGGPSALNNDVSISASSVIILRYLADGRMVPIEVDLYKARMDVAEQVIIQPGDYLLLQYTKAEALAAFFERHLLEGALFGLAGAQLTRNNGN